MSQLEEALPLKILASNGKTVFVGATEGELMSGT
jgi:hypothetical protein